VKYGKKWSWENILMLFSQPVIENIGGDGFLGAGLAKNKFCTDIVSLLHSSFLSKEAAPATTR
jgi:hypothetical protein